MGGHIWENCIKGGRDLAWQDMVGCVLGEEEEGEVWMREVECIRNERGGDGGEGVGGRGVSKV